MIDHSYSKYSSLYGLFLDQTEARRAEKNLFGDPLPPYLRVWMTGPPLIGRPGSATVWGTSVKQMPFTSSIIPQ